MKRLLGWWIRFRFWTIRRIIGKRTVIANASFTGLPFIEATGNKTAYVFDCIFRGSPDEKWEKVLTENLKPFGNLGSRPLGE